MLRMGRKSLVKNILQLQNVALHYTVFLLKTKELFQTLSVVSKRLFFKCIITIRQITSFSCYLEDATL